MLSRRAVILFAALALAFTVVVPALVVNAQDKQTYRSELALAETAAKEGKHAEYLAHMRRVMELSPDRGNRPFYQYHLARAYALTGDGEGAAATLGELWNDRIEGPVIGFAELDPAFDKVRSHEAYRKIQSAYDTLRIETLPALGSVVELRGAGCNLAASIGPDGVLFVDSGYPRTTKAILAAVKKQSGSTPNVRFIVNTHGHFDHTASNHAVGKDAIVVAHPAAAALMTEGFDYVPGFRIPAVEGGALPDLMTDSSLTIPFNGETVHVVALPAHTPGDLIVWFEGSKVLHMGDNYFPATSALLYPGPSPAPYFERFGPLVSRITDDTIVLSGHEERTTGAALKETYRKTEALFRLVGTAIEAGRSDDEIRTEGEAQGYIRPWINYYLKALRPKE